MLLKPNTISFVTPKGDQLSEMLLSNWAPGKIKSKLLSLSKAYPGQEIIIYNGFVRLRIEVIESKNY
jgi:hypothetical protein